jgi:hypothetical protein
MSGHLGVVGARRTRIEVGLERKLAEQRQAERVDGADPDFSVRSRSSRQRARNLAASAAARSVVMIRSRISAGRLAA